MAYLKHSGSNGKGKRAKAAKVEAGPSRMVLTGPSADEWPLPRSLQHSINHVGGLADIEDSLDWIARGLSKLTDDEHYVHLSTEGTHPIRITLAPDDYEDVMERFVTAVERIADSVAKLAGFSRPRLEHWYEQDEYTPRYKDIAADGGAPGPKKEA